MGSQHEILDTSGQLHEIRECVRASVNAVSMSVYGLLKCLGIVNCPIRPTKRGTQGVKKRHILIVVTVLKSYLRIGK